LEQSHLKDQVYQIIKSVPPGKVVSYGQVAAMAGHYGAARQVGQIAHLGPSSLPWHRLVKADGSMASGFIPGGPKEQADLLSKEGIKFKNNKVVMKEHQL